MEYVIKYADHILHSPSIGRFVTDAKCELEAGTVGSLTFTLPFGHPYHDIDFKPRNTTSEVTLEEDGVELFRGRVKKAGGDIDANINVECEGVLAYLKDTTVRPCANRMANDVPSGTVTFNDDPFVYLINQHNQYAGPEKSFEIARVPGFNQAFATTNYPTTYNAIVDNFCTGYDRYLRAYTGPRGQRVIDILDGGVGEGGQPIVLGENLIDLKTSTEAEDVVSVIIARGTYDDTDENGNRVRSAQEPRDFGLETISDGLHHCGICDVQIQGDRAINNDLVAKYGYVEAMRKYEASTPSELLECVAADLSPANLKTRELESAEVSAVDLHMENPDIRPIRLLEWQLVYARVLGINQYLPCSKISIDINDPANTVYTFGDLAKTLTRESSLRIGLQRKNSGLLMRRSDGLAHLSAENSRDTDELDDKVREHEEDERQKWDENDDKWKDQDAKNGDLLKGLDEVGDGIIALGQETDTKIQGIQELIDALEGKDTETDSRLAQVAQEIVKAAQESVFEGTCTTSGNVGAKTVTATAQNGRDFALTAGVMARVTFTHANEASSNLTLNVNSSGARQIRTNGANQAYWADNQTILFQFDGSYWMCCSSPVWVDSVTVGNPLGFNIKLEAAKLAMRLIEQEYMVMDPTGLRVGFEYLQSGSHAVGTRNIQFNSNYIDFRQSQVSYMRMDDTGVRVGLENNDHIKIGTGDNVIKFISPSHPNSDLVVGYNVGNSTRQIQSPAGVTMTDGDAEITVDNSQSFMTGQNIVLRASRNIDIGETGSRATEITFYGSSFGVASYEGVIPRYGKMDMFALVGMIRKSIVVNLDHNTNVAWVNKSTLGVSNLSHYAFMVTNGDWSANEVRITATSHNGDNLYVHFDHETTGNVRLNILGIQTDNNFLPASDPSDHEQPGI